MQRIQGFDAGAALQQAMAAEQWDMQKQLLQQQMAAGQQGAQGLAGLVNQYNAGYEQAKAANEARYQQMLGMTEQTTGQRLADIRAAGAQRSADIMSGLNRRGLGGTTIAPTMKAGVQDQTSAQLNRAVDELQKTPLGIMERRTDEYPRADIILALAQALGQNPAGPGGMVGILSGMNLGSA
jgi:hypothetical protein